MDIYCSCNCCYGRRGQKRQVKDSHLKINGPMKGVSEDNEETNMEMLTKMQNNDLKIMKKQIWKCLLKCKIMI